MAFDRTNDATEEKRYLNRIQNTLDKLQYRKPSKRDKDQLRNEIELREKDDETVNKDEELEAAEKEETDEEKLAAKLKERKEKHLMTHFNSNECTALALIFYKIIKEEGESTDMTSDSFSQILHFAFEIPNNCVERVFSALEITTHVSLEKWLLAMSLFLRGTLEEQIDYCFKIYDVNGDGQILRENMLPTLSKCLIKKHKDITDEALKDLVDIIIKKADKNGDGMISYKDYKETVLEDPLFMECLGPCYPNRACVYSFLATFTDRFLNY